MSVITRSPTRDPLESIPVAPTEPEIPPAAVVLRRARDLISRRGGWIKEDLQDENRYCSLGAINAIAAPEIAVDDYGFDDLDHDSIRNQAIFALVVAIEGSLPTFTNSNKDTLISYITGYNDAPSRRKHQIIAKFNKAIKSLIEE